MWEARCLELTSTKEVPPPLPKTAAPARSPADFLTSFPLTLPTFALSYQDDQHPAGEWHTYSPSSPSSSSSSEAMPDNLLGDPSSPLISPSPSMGSASFVLAPRSPSSSLFTNSTTTSEAAAAMRAAYEAGVRKKRSFYSRYSLTADLSPASSMTNLHAAGLPKTIVSHTTHVGTPNSPYGNVTPVGVVVAASPGEEAPCTVGPVH